MSDDARGEILMACQAICLLLGAEALMRIRDALDEPGLAEARRLWLDGHRRQLGPLLDILAEVRP
jgi:hypothetical protein